MTFAIEAIYEGGILKPLEPLDLPDHQVVTLTVHFAAPSEPRLELEAWHQIYAGLKDQDIQEIEEIALDRSNFLNEGD